MTGPDSWLDTRLAAAPPALRAAVRRAAGRGQGGGEAGGVEARLLERAERLLADACTGPPTRETALTLLAADALITLSREWAAEHDPRGLAHVV